MCGGRPVGHPPGCIFHLLHPSVCWGTSLGSCTGEDSAWLLPRAQPGDIKRIFVKCSGLTWLNKPHFYSLMRICQSLVDIFLCKLCNGDVDGIDYESAALHLIRTIRPTVVGCRVDPNVWRLSSAIIHADNGPSPPPPSARRPFYWDRYRPSSEQRGRNVCRPPDKRPNMVNRWPKPTSQGSPLPAAVRATVLPWWPWWQTQSSSFHQCSCWEHEECAGTFQEWPETENTHWKRSEPTIPTIQRTNISGNHCD